MSETSKVLSFAVPPVVKAVTVRCPPATAFRRFTEDLAAWWPLATHHISDDPQSCALERRLAFTWQVKTPAEQAQRINVTFTPAAGGTRVELVHSGWEKLGDAAAARRDSYNKGWVRVFEQCYADYANSGAA